MTIKLGINFQILIAKTLKILLTINYFYKEQNNLIKQYSSFLSMSTVHMGVT